MQKLKITAFTFVIAKYNQGNVGLYCRLIAQMLGFMHSNTPEQLQTNQPQPHILHQSNFRKEANKK